MTTYPIPKNEKTRLKELHLYNILDTIPEEEFNRITKIASSICNTPVSLMTLLDENRQWIKSSHGFQLKETPRAVAFCNHTILDPDNVLEVPDLRKDERFSSNPLVTGAPNVVFYAGAPLITPSGHVLGSICVMDSHEKKLDDNQREALVALSQQVMNTLELRKTIRNLRTTKVKLRNANQKLQSFASLVSHDLKTPIANINMLTGVLEREHLHNYVAMTRIVQLINNSSIELLSFIDNVLERSKNANRSKKLIKKVDAQVLVEDVIRMIAPQSDVKIKISNQLPVVKVEHSLLSQVIHNLISNAIKYNDKKFPEISIQSITNKHFHSFTISDNGHGIPQDKLSMVFQQGATCHATDRYGKQGTGLGLHAVKSMLEEIGGRIEVSSVQDHGAAFTFQIPVSA